MRIFNRSTVRAYARKHADAAVGLWQWFDQADKANWGSFQEVRATDPSVSLVGDRLVFNVNGNRHRVVCRVDWSCQFLFIRFIGNHVDYTRIDVRKV